MFTRINNVFLGGKKKQSVIYVRFKTLATTPFRKIKWRRILKVHVIYSAINYISQIPSYLHLDSGK